MRSVSFFKNLLPKVSSRTLAKAEILSVIDESAKLFSREPTIRRFIGETLTVCGDVHGQYEDMQKIFSVNGQPSADNPYLFNGDFVDRGPYSVGCIVELLLHKLICPDSILLNKGNHELPEMNAYYGFRKEVGDELVWEKFNALFALLPIATVVHDSVFVVHGGLSKTTHAITSLELLEKSDPLFLEYLWNDPTDSPSGISPNPRGEGVFRFGPDVTGKFLTSNKLALLVRSHEMVDSGVEFSQEGKCLTVFSAPNYGGHFRNKGGFVRLRKGVRAECVQFERLDRSRSRL